VGDAYTLHLGDCRDLLRTMPDASVDTVITDPPYGEITRAGARTRKKGVQKLVHFNSLTTADFLHVCKELVRVSRRWVVLFCDWRHAIAAEQAGLPVVRLGVWIKIDAAPQFTGDRPGVGWEAVLILHRPGRKRWNGGGCPAVWQSQCARGNHPTEKPVPLLREWIRLFTDPGEVVFDPFAGSGSTGVAALSIGRRFVGCEIDPNYHAIALQRLAKVACEGGLFRQTQLFPFKRTP